MAELFADDLMLYFGDDYVINDKIKIHQPVIDELVKYGEASYFSTIYTLCAIPSDMKSILWDMPERVDWTKISDFELFMMLAPTMSQDRTGLLFPNIDFSRMKPFLHPQNGEPILVDKENRIVIDNLIYMRAVGYLRKLHGIKPKVDKAKGKRAKEAMIEEDRRNREFKKDKPFNSYLLPMISALKTKQGYTKDYVRNMGLYEFFDEVARLQVINNADHLLDGIYSGSIDAKKIKKEELNWFRELDK